MGVGTLTDRTTGQTILQEFFNDIHGALDGSMIGRNASGVATAGQDLGTPAIPWGTIRGSTLVLGGVAIDTSQIVSQVNRVISGKKRSTSNQPAFLTPNGSAASFILAGATTNLVVDINGSSVTASTDITKSSLSTAPGSNNTCTLDDASAVGQEDTKVWGEIDRNYSLTVDAMGSEITALVGTFQAFKTGTEYFFGYVESSTKISKCFRGYFYNSSLAPVNRVALTDNDTITLMKLGFVYLQDDGTTIDVGYTNPTYAYVAPNGPASGDYWYDLSVSQWKRYDGATFQVINRTLIGMVVMDTTNCKVARCLPFYGNFSPLNTMDLEISTVSIVRAKGTWSRVSVAGNTLVFGDTLTQWNITTNLAPAADMYNATEQSSTVYYMYLKDTGDIVISDISPYVRNEMFGRYHPHNPWRCIGSAYNDSGSDFIKATGLPQNGSGTIMKGMTSTKFTTAGADTYVPPYGCAYLKILAVGGGAGGAGGGGAGIGNGSSGTATTFGGSVISAGGGSQGGTSTANGGSGGTASCTISSPSPLLVNGGYGGTEGFVNVVGSLNSGGHGGIGYLGGGGSGAFNANNATAGATNTGAGGGGGGSSNNNQTGAGGGSGAAVIAILDSIPASVAIVVGAKGVGGTAGSNGGAGGDGADGQIYIEEYYA